MCSKFTRQGTKPSLGVSAEVSGWRGGCVAAYPQMEADKSARLSAATLSTSASEVRGKR